MKIVDKVVNYLEKYYKKPELLFSQTDEKGKPLTYWGGVDFTNSNTNNITSNSTQIYQKGIQGYIYPITKIQCDDECCVSAENCHIKTSIDVLVEPEKDRTCNHTNCIEVCPECKPYFISDNCEEVKNWDNFAEQKNLELLAEEVYGKGIKPDYEEGFIDGYNKAKETLYTEFDIIKAFEYGWNQRHYGIDDEMLLREIQNNLIKSLKQD